MKEKEEKHYERIKTFDDAVQATGITLHLSDKQLARLSKDVVAFMKLRVIAAALNGLHKTTLSFFPAFHENETRYFPLFFLYTRETVEQMDEKDKAGLWLFGGDSITGSACGFASASSGYVWSYSYSSIAARLAVKSSDMAIYFGTQFISLWADYLFGAES